MTDGPRAGEASRRLAVGVFVPSCLGLVVGLDPRLGAVAVLALVSGGLVGGAARRTGTDTATAVRTSLGFGLGAASLVGALVVGAGVPGGLLVVPVPFGGTLVLVHQRASPRESDSTRPEIAFDTWAVLGIGLLLPAVPWVARQVALLALWSWTVPFGTTLARLVLLQAVLLAVVGLSHAAGRILTGLLPGRDLPESPAGPTPGVSLEAIAVVVVQVVLLVPLSLMGAPATFEALLAGLGPIGAVLRWVLSGGVVHLALLALAVPPALVLWGEACRVLVDRLPADGPRELVADAAGGLVIVVPFGLGVVGLAVTDHVLVLGGDPSRPLALWLGGLIAVGLALAALVAVVAGLRTVHSRSRRFVPLTAGGVLLGLAVAVALAGGPPIAAVAGIAAALVVWDLSATGGEIRDQLGEHAATGRVELTHAGGTTAVGVLAVAFAAASLYVLTPVASSLAPRTGYGVLVLLLCALLAFGRVLVPSGESGAGE